MTKATKKKIVLPKEIRIYTAVYRVLGEYKEKKSKGLKIRVIKIKSLLPLTDEVSIIAYPPVLHTQKEFEILT